MNAFRIVSAIILSIVLMSSGCADSALSSSKEMRTQISGKIENGAGKMLFVNSINKNRGQKIDTITVGEDGTFNHTLSQGLKLDYYIISNVRRGNQVYLITDSTETISFNADYNQLASAEISGSEATSVFNELSQMVSETNKKLSEFDDQIIAAKTIADKKKIGAEKRSLRSENIGAVEAYIDAHSDSPGIAAFFENIDFTKHPELAQKTINYLAKVVPNSSYYQTRAQQVAQYANPNVKIAERPDKGKVAPNIELPDPAGKERTLYELRGKTVLVDFWASWCGPCRRENPNVVKAYNKYHDAGFEVLSVSLDSDKARWIQAIEEDGLIWDTHVSDLLKWQTPYKTLYGFSGIPHAVLVNKDGVILDSKIRGAQLEEYLEEIFGY